MASPVETPREEPVRYDRAYLKTLVCERFRTDERYRLGHIRIIAARPGTEILGLHTPEMKMVAKALARSDSWPQVLSRWERAAKLSHDERMIWGLVLDYIKCPLAARLELVGHFLPHVDNWAICDTFCCNSAWAKKRQDRDALRAWLGKLVKSREEFTRRCGLVLLMCHFLDDAACDRTLETLGSLNLRAGEPYYVRMAVAWLLATALAKQPERTRLWLKGATLPPDIRALYVRKVRESRITRDASPF